MKKIIVEIDGQRHRLVHSAHIFDVTCDDCSLMNECETPICHAFCHNNYCHFEKEEEV